MPEPTRYRPLGHEDIQQMQQQGCVAEDWLQIKVADGFQPERVRNVRFSGAVRIGSLAGSIDCGEAIHKPSGIENALLVNCTIGDHARIVNIGVHLANYDIGPGVLIENVGVMETRPGAKFGNGVEIEPLNEGGGREVVLFNRLDAQFAYLMCLHRYRPTLIDKLQAVSEAEAAKVCADRGSVGTGARISNVKRLVDVNLGDYAVIEDATSLVNGTVLSHHDAPTTIGGDVQADNFIVAEGTQVDGGAIVSSSFIGQGCQIGKQFSCEGSLFFANSEGFHGEACSVFGGPYTVTHHKSTLLIAGLFSFYNAGSGTNQSNHLYKLGPVHEGRLERGCKTGSFSYLMWPCRVGPFSVVLGKHTRTFDTADFPFSYLEALPDGRCLMTPGFNLTTVGTVRDGAKWPARDRRRGPIRRDRISFDVFSPLTVGRMIAGMAQMKELQEKTDRSVDLVSINGTEVKRLLLRTGQKTFRLAVQMYLLDKVVAQVESAMQKGSTSLTGALAVSDDAVLCEAWVDIGGQMMPHQRLDDLSRSIETGRFADLDALNEALDKVQAAYAEDEWAWVRQVYETVFQKALDDAETGDLVAMADELSRLRTKFLTLVLNDATKEFEGPVLTGFGQDGTQEDVAADFSAIRGQFETNKFVRQLKDEISALEDRIERFKQSVVDL